MSDSDAIFVSGDFNARLGSLSDTSGDFNSIPGRISIDISTNQHGREFCEFLIDSKFCVLNGRFNSAKDIFTSISQKGRATLDYICVPHDVFQTCKHFSVSTVQSLVDNYKLHHLLETRSKLPDHSFIVTEFETWYQAYTGTETYSTVSEEYPTKRFKLNRIPKMISWRVSPQLCRF